MSEAPEAMEALAAQVRDALDSDDLEAYAPLLAPDCTWGAPGADEPECRSRTDVMAWYTAGRDFGIRASVAETTVVGDRLVVGLEIRGRPGAATGSVGRRWQVLTVSNGLVAEIVGFEDADEALAYAGQPSSA